RGEATPRAARPETAAPSTGPRSIRSASSATRASAKVGGWRNRVHTGATPVPAEGKPLTRPDEVDEPAFDVGRDQLDAELVADPEAFPSLRELPFDRGIEDPDPRPLVRGARDDAVEALADPTLEKERRRRFADLPLDLVRGVFHLGAVPREGLEI